jgi:hypothetical protein
MQPAVSLVVGFDESLCGAECYIMQCQAEQELGANDAQWNRTFNSMNVLFHDCTLQPQEEERERASLDLWLVWVSAAKLLWM